MISLFEPFTTWRLPLHQFSPEHWAKLRAKGRAHFVLRQTFSFALFFIALNDVVTQLLDDHQPFTLGFLNIILYVFTGICVGYTVWCDQERQYKKEQLKSSPQASFRTINLR